MAQCATDDHDQPSPMQWQHQWRELRRRCCVLRPRIAYNCSWVSVAVEARPVRRACDPSESCRQPAPRSLACRRGSPCTWLLPRRTACATTSRMQYTDQTFKGLYHWNLFDAALLLPYFAVMILLAIYGVHRYTMCYLYYKYRKNYNPNPPQPLRRAAPRHRATAHLQRAVRHRPPHRSRLRHGVSAATSWKSRSSTTPPTRPRQVAAAIVARYAALGHPIVYIHRTNRHGYKAGALDAGLKVAKGEFVAIFDADFVPPHGLAHEGHPPLCRAGDRHGADPLDPPQPRLQHVHPD